MGIERRTKKVEVEKKFEVYRCDFDGCRAEAEPIGSVGWCFWTRVEHVHGDGGVCTTDAPQALCPEHAKLFQAFVNNAAKKSEAA